MMHQIQLTEEELNTCVMLGCMRAAVSRGTNTVDRKMGGQPGFLIDADGVTGEFAFCKLRNIFFDPTQYTRSGGVDCVLEGKRIDVKTTRRDNGRLVVTTKKNPEIDVFVLAIFDQENRTVRFPGYAMASDLYQPKNLTDLGRGQTYVLTQQELRPWREIKAA